VDRALPEHRQDDGEAAGGTGDLDTVVGLPLRQAEGVPAIDVERGIPFAQVDVARVQLRQVRDDLGRDPALAPNQGPDLRDEVSIGEASETSEKIVMHTIVLHMRSYDCGRTNRVRVVRH
jgi:hypothetical protein